MNKQKETQEKIFIGVSWPYANGNIHIGHLAGQYIVCDIFARYHRQKGNKVLMVSGSDSHGAPVIFAAEEEGIEPGDLADRSHKTISDTYTKLGLLYENYTTTRTENHKIVSQNIFLVLDELGFLEKKTTRQYFDPKVKRFLPDRYVRGTCPNCGATNARGDECPECGEFLEPEDLKNPYSTLSDATPEMRETTHYYLDLGKVEGDLKEWLKDKTYWRKWVREFTLGWLRGGLKPRAVTRDFSYGVPVPKKGWENKVLYVWIEAVVGYLSAAIEWAQKQGSPHAWEDFWKDPDCKHYYFIAGGNVPFHTIIWPAELIGYNQKFGHDNLWREYKLPGETLRKPLNLPYDVPANNILTYRGKKMSKGDKVGITLDTLLERYDPDVIRYFFARYAPENQDREFIWKDFIEANNNELVANLGNFINRVLSFTSSKFEGTVPGDTLDKNVEDAIQKAFSDTGSHIEKAQFVKALESILHLGHFANKYFNDEEPWNTIKTNPEKAAHTIYNSLQITNALRILIRPILPFSSDKLSDLLSTRDDSNPNKELAETGAVKTFENTWKFEELPSGHLIQKPDILFPKLEYTDDLEKEDNPEPELYITTDEIPPGVSDIDENIVIGVVKTIARHPDKESLSLVEVDTKEPIQRKIVCGAQNLNVGDVVPVALPGSKFQSDNGTKTKISETTIHGVKSEGMLCSPAELGAGTDNKTILILPTSLSEFTGKPLSQIKSVLFSKDPELSDIPTAWTVIKDIRVSQNIPKKLSAWMKEQQEAIKKTHSDDSWMNDPIHAAYRDLHRKYGAPDTPGSPEEIISFIVEKGSVPNINTVVDLYNVYSALSGVSIGAHDIEKIEGQPRLEILKDDISFKHATTNKSDTARKGEYAYRDDEGILCRLDIKQGNRTNVTKDTNHVLVLFQGNDGVTQEDVNKSIEDFKKLVHTFIEK